MRARATLIVLIAAVPGAAAALDLPPGAEITSSRTDPSSSSLVATGPWQGGALPSVAAEGTVSITAARVPGPVSTLDLLVPLRDELSSRSFETLLDCATDVCGGFDFRYAIPVLPEPEMHVDLGDYRYLSARRGETWAAVLVSRSDAAGFVQIIEVSPAEVRTSPPAAAAPDAPVAAPGDAPLPPGALGGTPLIAALVRDGHVALDDLTFETGSSGLASGTYPSLAALAAYLARNPEARITLVGHTDTEGSLDANVMLSRRRAQAVADRLVADYGAPRARVAFDGVGYLAPRATNATPEGRALNRRVEAVLD